MRLPLLIDHVGLAKRRGASCLMRPSSVALPGRIPSETGGRHALHFLIPRVKSHKYLFFAELPGEYINAQELY